MAATAVMGGSTHSMRDSKTLVSLSLPLTTGGSWTNSNNKRGAGYQVDLRS
jgi:hypothetical protein